MPLTTDDEKAMPTAKRLVVLRAEVEARLAALEGGTPVETQLNNLKWLAAEIWELERLEKAPGR